MFKTKVSDRISSNGSMGCTMNRVQQQQTLQVPTRTAHLEKMPEKNEAKGKADVSYPFEEEDQSNFQGLLTSVMILSGINVKLNFITAIHYLCLFNAKSLPYQDLDQEVEELMKSESISYQDLNQELEEIMAAESISYQDLENIMKVSIDLKEIMDASIDLEKIMDSSLPYQKLGEIMESSATSFLASLNTIATDDKTHHMSGGIADEVGQVAKKQIIVRGSGHVPSEHETSKEASDQEAQDNLFEIPAVVEELRVGEIPFTEDLNTKVAFVNVCLKAQEISRKWEHDEEMLVLKRRELRIAESRLALEKEKYKAQQKHADLLQQIYTQREGHTLADTDDSEGESGSD